MLMIEIGETLGLVLLVAIAARLVVAWWNYAGRRRL
jgi:hypothetical protein